MTRMVWGLVYVLIGSLVTLLLNQLQPGLGGINASLIGMILTLSLVGVHIFLILRSELQNQKIQILKLRKELNTSFSMSERTAPIGRAPMQEEVNYESLLGEIRVIQSVMDRIIQDRKINTEEGLGEGVTEKSSLNDKQIMGLLNDAVKSDRIEVFLQPIVSLPQRKLRFYEMFSRIRGPDGQLVSSERFVKLADEGGVLSGIDNLQLLRCIQMIRDSDRRNSNLRFFCNIASTTLRDTRFMTELVQFLGQNTLLTPKLIFELSQADLASMSADLVPVLDGLGRLGCRFSMDGVYSLDFPMAALSARKIRTVKIDAEVLLFEAKRPSGTQQLINMKESLDKNSIDLIVSKIESENTLRELLDLNIDYGQGYLFGEPRANWPVT